MRRGRTGLNGLTNFFFYIFYNSFKIYVKQIRKTCAVNIIIVNLYFKTALLLYGGELPGKARCPAMMRLHRASRLLSWQETYCQLETLIIRICLVVINSCKVSLCFTNLNTCIEDIATKPSLPANVSWEELSIQRLRPVNHKELVQSETLWRSILDLYGQLCPGGVYSICMDKNCMEKNVFKLASVARALDTCREYQLA